MSLSYFWKRAWKFQFHFGSTWKVDSQQTVMMNDYFNTASLFAGGQIEAS